MSRGGSAAAWTAGLGGLLSLAATVLLPFHLGGGLGTWIAVGFLLGGLLLAGASIGFAGSGGGGWLRFWAVLGAAGFAVSGVGLVGDVVDRPWVDAEIAAVVAVAVWWTAVWWRLRGERPGRGFGCFSLLCAVSSLAALAAEVAWEPPAGAVPARFAYVLWGPWGLWLAAVRHRRRRIRG